MKEVKSFIIAELVVILVKILGGFITNSYPLMASAIFDVMLLLVMISTGSTKENKKSKGIVSSILGFVFILLGLALIFLSVITNNTKVSFWVIFFVILSVVVRYIVNCVYTNSNYQRKKGILSIGLINSNVDFYIYGVVLGGLILAKLSKWVSIFKYSNILGTILIVILIIYKGSKIIINSFRYMEEYEVDSEDVIKEIEARDEIKKVKEISASYYGGFCKTTCDIVLKDGINLIDLNSFIVTLQDFLLKKADIVRINLVEDKKKVVRKKTKVRSLKQDARNSRSRNSKTNTKKKNTKKKNSKR